MTRLLRYERPTTSKLIAHVIVPPNESDSEQEDGEEDLGFEGRGKRGGARGGRGGGRKSNSGSLGGSLGGSDLEKSQVG